MTKPSLLERAARAIEPKPSSDVSSVARRIRPLTEIKGARKMLANLPKEGGAKPTNGHVTLLDGQTKLLYFTDGSLRHPGGKINGKDARKARARAKRGHHAPHAAR